MSSAFGLDRSYCEPKGAAGETSTKAREGATRLLEDVGVAKESFQTMLSLLKEAYVLEYSEEPNYKALQTLLQKCIDLLFFFCAGLGLTMLFFSYFPRSWLFT